MNDGRRYSDDELRGFAATFARDGFVRLDQHPAVLARWQIAFAPLLARQLTLSDGEANRGSARYYVTLPLELPFADPSVYDDPDIVDLCKLLVGDDLKHPNATIKHGSLFRRM
jgi:hypothetical protein